MGRKQNYIGRKFNGQEVIDQKGEYINDKYVVHILVKCHCGNIRWLKSPDSVFKSNSCGCLRSQLVSKSKIKHGGCYTRLYTIRLNMIHRCTTVTDKHYKSYGGRGITVCQEWLDSFVPFKEWADKTGYNDTLTIDRIDNNKGYSPDNCRWATYKQQGRNKRDTVYMTLHGVTKPLQEWCDELHLNTSRVEARKLMGWTDEDCLLLRKNGKHEVDPNLNLITYKGETKSLRDWCTVLGLDYIRIGKRYYRGWDTERMFTQPLIRRNNGR